ncbi:serine/threonine kinase [Aureococcus anophagefferens]|nr:serine/threonine kinase [Aureococcus anophagefferens]
MLYNRRFVNVVAGVGGKRFGPNSNAAKAFADEAKLRDGPASALAWSETHLFVGDVRGGVAKVGYRAEGGGLSLAADVALRHPDERPVVSFAVGSGVLGVLAGAGRAASTRWPAAGAQPRAPPDALRAPRVAAAAEATLAALRAPGDPGERSTAGEALENRLAAFLRQAGDVAGSPCPLCEAPLPLSRRDVLRGAADSACGAGPVGVCAGSSKTNRDAAGAPDLDSEFGRAYKLDAGCEARRGVDLGTGAFSRVVKATKRMANNEAGQAVAVKCITKTPDLKAEDIASLRGARELLLKSPYNDFDIKLADFGFAKKVNGKSLDTQCGTPGYVAPEILKGAKYGTEVDMWSCGVIVYILLGGYPPFHDDNHAILYRKIKAADYTFEPQYWDQVSDDAKDLIKKMLVVDPDKRLTADQALRHPWFLVGDHELISRNLSTTLDTMKKFNARRKFRGTVKASCSRTRWPGLQWM